MQDDECEPLLGGSGVVISGVISPLIWVIIIVTLLLTPLITTPEPPSGWGRGRGGVGGFAVSQESVSLVTEAKLFASCRRTRPPIPAL